MNSLLISRRSISWVPLLVVTLLLSPRIADAVIIIEKGKTAETRGLLVSADETRVRIRVVTTDENGKNVASENPIVILRDDIDLLIETVDKERLTALDPQNPAGYRNYAEELAEKKKDPDAHAMAMRLYLIAAYLDGPKLGRSSFLGLTSLARSTREAQSFRALAYLSDPSHDRRVLKKAAAPVQTSKTITPTTEARDALITGLRRLQADDFGLALRSIEKPGVKEFLSRYQHIMLYEELFLICKRRKLDLSNADVRKILALEVNIIRDGNVVAPTTIKKDSGADWSTIVYTKGHDTVPNARLEYVTEFDPRLCRFVDGKWVKP